MVIYLCCKIMCLIISYIIWNLKIDIFIINNIIILFIYYRIKINQQ